MKKYLYKSIFLNIFFVIIFKINFIFGQLNSEVIKEYKKLCLENKIGGDTYMTLLLTATSLSAAESEGVLKTKTGAEPKIDEKKIDKEYVKKRSND